MYRNHRVVMLFGLLLIGAVMVGCSSSSPRGGESVASIAALERARARLAEAERAGAAVYGNAELGLAREKLREAENAAQEGETERAERLAAEAAVDADYALAVNRNRETQALATEVRSGLRTLEEELRRNARDGSRE